MLCAPDGPHATSMHAAPKSLIAALLVLAASCASPTQSFNEGARTTATPTRPTYSMSTFTTAAGTLELETGVYVDPSDASSVPTTLKYGVTDRADALLTFSPASAVEGGGVGIGDVYLGWRQRLTEQQQGHLSLAYLAQVKLPTANEDKGLGTGEFDAFLAGIGTLPMTDWSMTGYAELGLVGDPNGSGADLQVAVAAAGDKALSGNAGLFGELAGVFNGEQDYEAVFTTLGGTWSPVPGLVLDSGIVLGLSQDAPDYAFVVGLTRNLGPARGYAMSRTRN